MSLCSRQMQPSQQFAIVKEDRVFHWRLCFCTLTDVQLCSDILSPTFITTDSKMYKQRFCINNCTVMKISVLCTDFPSHSGIYSSKGVSLHYAALVHHFFHTWKGVISLLAYISSAVLEIHTHTHARTHTHTHKHTHARTHTHTHIMKVRLYIRVQCTCVSTVYCVTVICVIWSG